MTRTIEENDMNRKENELAENGGANEYYDENNGCADHNSCADDDNDDGYDSDWGGDTGHIGSSSQW